MEGEHEAAVDAGALAAFRQLVLDYYRAHGRHDLPWRQPQADGAFDPYAILVSELMLQQTQVPRVLPKFTEFMRLFPSAEVLAAAPLSEVLRAWSGLGYNRRAKFLWQTAQAVVERHGGVLPAGRAELVALPGVGSNTAGAILAYAFNQPVVFIETNIRSVFIHHFFADETAVADSAIAELLERIVLGADPPEPRTWYWALMDYGTHLKQTAGNAARASAGYTRQSKFEGSRRQIRGRVLRELTQGPRSMAELRQLVADARLASVIDDLLAEGFIRRDADDYSLT